MRSLSPFFAVAFIGRAYTVHTRAYIIRSIRYLMAVSVSDVYPTLRSSPPWPRSFFVESHFSSRIARDVCNENARTSARGLPFSDASDAKHFFFFFHLYLRAARDRFEIWDRSRREMARRGHAFFRSESPIVPHVNRRFIGRTRPRDCSSLRDERSGQVAGGTRVPGRSNKAASG